jgi:hypothetical protein
MTPPRPRRLRRDTPDTIPEPFTSMRELIAQGRERPTLDLCPIKETE